MPEGITVKDILEEHLNKYGEAFRKWVFLSVPGKTEPVIGILLNALPISSSHPQGLNTKLQDGDEIIFGGVAGAA